MIQYCIEQFIGGISWYTKYTLLQNTNCDEIGNRKLEEMNEKKKSFILSGNILVQIGMDFST